MAGLKFGWNVESMALAGAAILFGPTVLNATCGVLRFLLKSGIKGGILLYHQGKELSVQTRQRVESMAAEAKESMEDLVAEAKAEISEPSRAVKKRKAR